MSLNNLRVGTRLGAGFAMILLLLAAMLLISVVRLNSTATSVQEMMASPLAKERLVDEQLRNISVGVTRGKAIAKSADGSLEALFRDETAAGTTRGAEIVKALGDLPMNAEEKVLVGKFEASRTAYLDSRNRVMAAKREGRAEEANRIYETEFGPSSTAYVSSMEAMDGFERKTIDDLNAQIAVDTSSGRLQLILLGLVAISLGVVLAWLLTRSITQPMVRAVRLARTPIARIRPTNWPGAPPMWPRRVGALSMLRWRR